MNRKQFVILLALVAVIGAAGLMVYRRGGSSWHSGGAALGGELLPGLAINDIAQITITSGTNELNLARRDNLWRVRERGDYPANFSQIRDLLIKFGDLKVIQSEEIGPSQLGRFDLLPPGPAADSGTLVEFKDQSGKTLDAILLGKEHMKQPAASSQLGGMGDMSWPDGRYVIAGAGAKSVAVISDPLADVQTAPEQWLNKEFISIEKPGAIAVQFPEATNSWRLVRASETNDWRLADARPGETLDASAISSVTSPFNSASFTDVAPADPAETAGQTNLTVLRVETFDGFTYVARIGQERNGDYPVTFTVAASLAAERAPATGEQAGDKAGLDKAFQEEHDRLAEKLAKEKQCENWVYTVPADNIDEILKPRWKLLAVVETLTKTGTNTLAQPQLVEPPK